MKIYKIKQNSKTIKIFVIFTEIMMKHNQATRKNDGFVLRSSYLFKTL